MICPYCNGTNAHEPGCRTMIFSVPPTLNALDMARRAMICVRPHRTSEAPRWVAVMDTFGYGSTVATELCRRFGYDPNEKIKGVPCDCEDTN